MIWPVKHKHWRKMIHLYLNLSMLFRGRSRTPAIGGEWPSGLRHCNHIRMIPGLNPIGALSGLNTQCCYKAPVDLWFIIRIKKMQRLIGFPIDIGPKLALGQPGSR